MPRELAAEALRARLRSLVWWSLGLTSMVALTVAFYPSLRGSEALAEYGRDLPESLRAMFAGGETDITSPVGYLNSQIFAALAPVLMLVFAIGAGASAIAGDEEQGGLEIVLSHPVRRRDLVLARFVALAVLVAGLSLALLVSVAVGSAAVGLEIGLGSLVAASASVGMLGILFGALALAAGSLHPGRGRAVALAAALAVAAWMLDGLGQAAAVLEPWRPLSPLYQAMGQSPLREGIPWTGFALLSLATAGLLVLAAAGLERRDTGQ